MHEIALKYVGRKKRPRTVDIPKFKNKLLFGHEPVWMPAEQANWLMEINPAMFQKVGEKNAAESFIEDAEVMLANRDRTEEDEDEQFVCEKCGKDYKVESFYLRHIEKCEGSND